MDNEKILDIVAASVVPCLNNGYAITDDAIADIAEATEASAPFAEAMHHVAEWFNRQNVAAKDEEDINRYVGASINILSLLAAGDVVSLVDNWILLDM